jgi:hypothetical protein
MTDYRVVLNGKNLVDCKEADLKGVLENIKEKNLGRYKVINLNQ